MLILSRDAGEQVTITLEDGRTIIVTMCGTKSGHFKLGFDADRSIRIDRTELLHSYSSLNAKGGSDG